MMEWWNKTIELNKRPFLCVPCFWRQWAKRKLCSLLPKRNGSSKRAKHPLLICFTQLQWLIYQFASEEGLGFCSCTFQMVSSLLLFSPVPSDATLFKHERYNHCWVFGTVLFLFWVSFIYVFVSRNILWLWAFRLKSSSSDTLLN